VRLVTKSVVGTIVFLATIILIAIALRYALERAGEEAVRKM